MSEELTQNRPGISSDDTSVVVIARSSVSPVKRVWPADDREYIRTTASVGAPIVQGLSIAVEEAVLVSIREHARTFSDREIGGILLGEWCQDGARSFVMLQAALRADTGQSFAGAFIFTCETLLHLEAERERRFPSLRVIGWYHSHPGFGVFYSATDNASHETQFPESYHVGLVVDPIKRQDGFFVWQAGRLSGPHGFWMVKSGFMPDA